ncbi:MAG: hypothetical protein CMI01_02480 [Oceanospirillaceae bacterium]|nr:hypothetical protein [Oceanospirillaceae bacterium]
MKKLALPVFVLVVLAAAGVYWFTQGAGGAKGLTSYVPADTVVYFGGTPDPKVVEQMRDYPVAAVEPAQLENLFSELARQEGGNRSQPGRALLEAWVLDFVNHGATYGELFDHYGISLNQPQAIYMHGLFPVIRLPVADQAAFDRVWQSVSERSGVSPKEEMREQTRVQRWPLTPAGAPQSVELVVATQDSLATITFFSSFDTEQAQLERLGLSAPETSLADSGELREIIKTQGFSETFAGFLHIRRLAEGLLETSSSTLANDWAALNRALGQPNPLTGELEPVCRDEIAGLFGAAPRMLLGYTNASTQGDAITIEARSLLEITAPGVGDSLMKLRGHLPSHLQGEQMVGFGFGLNMDTLVPTLTELWNRFGQLSFQCPRLQQAQQQMAGTSPAMLGVFTGMAQGIQGAGVSLYDLTFSQASGLPESVDFLFSLATSNPELVISMFNTTVVPKAGGRVPKLPLDGALTEVDLGFLSPGLSATLGKQGEHLVVYSGEKGTEAAQALASETLVANGMMAMSVDYPRIEQWVSEIPNSILSQIASGESEFCMIHAKMRQTIRSQPMRMQYLSDIEKGGLSGYTRVQMLPSQGQRLTADAISGRYELRDLDQNCGQPPLIGHETINADGTGSYVEYDATGQCETLNYQYGWALNGSSLEFDVAEGQYRDGCQSPWGTLQAHQASCELIPTENGFDCIYTDEEGQGLYRYHRLP